MDVSEEVEWLAPDLEQTGPRVVGIAAGAFTVRAEGDAGLAGQATVVVDPELELTHLAVELSKTRLHTGQTASARAIARLADGRDVDVSAGVSWPSSDGSVASVRGGALIAHRAGVAAIRAVHLASGRSSAPVEVLVDRERRIGRWTGRREVDGTEDYAVALPIRFPIGLGRIVDARVLFGATVELLLEVSGP